MPPTGHKDTKPTIPSPFKVATGPPMTKKSSAFGRGPNPQNVDKPIPQTKLTPLAGQLPIAAGNKQYEIHTGDCQNLNAVVKPASVDMVFADPPFNIGHKYDVYHDSKSKAEFIEWLAYRMGICKTVMKPDASLFMCMGVALQAEAKVMLDRLGFYHRDTIVWHYTFGPCQASKFTPSWVAIHYYTMHPKRFTWNQDAIKVPSARQLKYKDARAKKGGKTPDNVWLLAGIDGFEEAFFPQDNVMLESRVAGTHNERTPHPAQMPLSIMNRLIAVATNKGDTVFDPFAGSGTTLEAAVMLGRKAIGYELSADYVKGIIIPRMEPVCRRAALLEKQTS